MANSDISKKKGAGKGTERLPAEKIGGLSLPATVEQPALRELRYLNGSFKGPSEIYLPEKKAESAPPPAGGAYYGGGADEDAGGLSSAASAESGPDLAFHMPEADAEARLRYENALAEIEALRGAAPRYDSRYDEQIRSLYEQLSGRGPFRYDSATDPLYQQYRQSYMQLGERAMRGAMGQAAALTGGYASSYAQSVGQQQYDAYLRRLADVLPETYGMALDAWQAEGQELQRRYSALTAREKSDYERYLDELGQYNRSLDRARSDADTAYERQMAEDERAYRRAVDDYERRRAEDETAYRRQQDAAAAAPQSVSTRVVIKQQDSKASSKKSSSSSKKTLSGARKSSGGLNKRMSR